MLLVIVKVALFLLPAGVANMTPPLMKWLPFLNVPLDAGYTFRNKRILGTNKTVRGLLFGVLAAVLCIFIQQSVMPHTFALVDMQDTYLVVYIGVLLGFGALAGDAVGSFIKRQFFEVPAGDPCEVVDQVPWIIGPVVVMAWYTTIPVYIYLLIFPVTYGVHRLVNLLAYNVGLQQNKQ